MVTCSLWWVNFIHGWILGWMMRKSWIQFLTLMNESSSCSHTEPPFIPNCWSYFMMWSSVSKFCSLGFVRLHIERADLLGEKSFLVQILHYDDPKLRTAWTCVMISTGILWVPFPCNSLVLLFVSMQCCFMCLLSGSQQRDCQLPKVRKDGSLLKMVRLNPKTKSGGLYSDDTMELPFEFCENKNRLFCLIKY